MRIAFGHAWYGEPGDLIEGISRTLWGVVPLLAGGAEYDVSAWRRAFANGTDPDHEEFWGWPGDFDQRIVEMAPFALGLLLAPRELWTELLPKAQSQIATWLEKVNTARPVESNWLFFRVLVNLALRRHGLRWSAENLENDLRRIESFYQHNGWYSDGLTSPTLRDGRVGDYYVAMGMHYYGLLFSTLAPAEWAIRGEIFTVRARQFAQDFVHWFAQDGSALPFGRSLTYRFAQGAFWGALAFANVEALPWGVMKGLYLRHLRWWIQQPIFTDAGLLSIGYRYPNTGMAESYNGPGSPYWGLKVFLPLALPDSHPFWSSKEEALPMRPSVLDVPSAGLVMMTTAKAQDVFAINAGQEVADWPRHAPHKYSKFAYSTRFGFSVPVASPTLSEGGFDSVLALSDDDRWYRHRDRCVDALVAGGVAFSKWTPWPDVQVETWLIADQNCHVRIHLLATERPIWSAEGGFAVGFDRRDSIRQEQQGQRIQVSTPFGDSGLIEMAGGRTGRLVELGVNSHLLHPLSVMPTLTVALGPGRFWLACVAYGTPPENRSSMLLPDYRVECEGESCRLIRNGRLWWERADGGCGISSDERLQYLTSLWTE